MRISDWSSDVCSSDLGSSPASYQAAAARQSVARARFTAPPARRNGRAAGLGSAENGVAALSSRAFSGAICINLTSSTGGAAEGVAMRCGRLGRALSWVLLSAALFQADAPGKIGRAHV